MHEWLTVIIVLLIVGILLDGVRRMRQVRRNSLRMSLDAHKDVNDEELQAYGSELPNGGARIANRQTEEQSPEGADQATSNIADESHTDHEENSIEGTENLSMFEVADECYAPDNATPEIKAAATAVVGHHNEDGIAEFLCRRFELD